MIYIHKDIIYQHKMYKFIKRMLDKKRVTNKVIDAHDLDTVKSLDVKDEDVLIAMFKHDKEDKIKTLKVFSTLADKFKTMYPSPESYYYYDDKLKQYEFMLENNIPCLETHYVASKKEIENLNINFPIVTKKTWGAGAEQVNYFETLDSIVDDETTRSWTQGSIYPCLVQKYKDVNYDIRIVIIGNKVFAFRRKHLWKTKNKNNFPYGTSKNSRERILKLKESPFKSPIIERCSKEEILGLHNLFVKLKEIQETKLNTKYMSWDIVDNKVLEFSIVSTMQHPPYYYDLKTKKIVNINISQFYMLEYLINEYT